MLPHNCTGSSDFVTLENSDVLDEFSDTVRRNCFDVDISDDSIFEDAERFTVSLAMPSGQDIAQLRIDPELATVEIIDDDRKSFFCFQNNTFYGCLITYNIWFSFARNCDWI